MSRPVGRGHPQPARIAAAADVRAPQNRHYAAFDSSGSAARREREWEQAQCALELFLCVHSPATQVAYRQGLTDSFGWLAATGITPLQAGPADLERYRAALQQAGLAPATIALRLTALAGLYRLAVRQGLLTASPMEQVRRPRVPRHSPHGALNLEEVRALLAAAAAHSTRAAALLTLLATTGLRVSAVCGADVTDLHRGPEGWLLRYMNKGCARLITVIPPLTQSSLETYLAGRSAGPLLLSRTARRLDRSAATRLVQRVAAAALPGRSDVTSHLLRAAYTGLALDQQAPLHLVQASLGHADPETTMRYARGRALLAQHPNLTVAACLRPDDLRSPG